MAHFNQLSLLSPRAQEAIALAASTALERSHNFIGTEHLLIGIAGLGKGRAFDILCAFGVEPERLVNELLAQIGEGARVSTGVPVALTPKVNRILTLAATEAQALRHTYIGTEHLLLGLLLDGDTVAARLLLGWAINLTVVRQAIIKTDKAVKRPPEASAG
jgi:ATP-dependent Clp protease ATP-binding subunit ClpC